MSKPKPELNPVCASCTSTADGSCRGLTLAEMSERKAQDKCSLCHELRPDRAAQTEKENPMSQKIPVFAPGDRVCVMQTSAMEAWGWANRRGMVLGVRPRGEYQVCLVVLDRPASSAVVQAEINSAHLEHVTAEEEARWDAALAAKEKP